MKIPNSDKRWGDEDRLKRQISDLQNLNTKLLMACEVALYAVQRAENAGAYILCPNPNYGRLVIKTLSNIIKEVK